MNVEITGTIAVYMDSVDIEQANLKYNKHEEKSIREVVERASRAVINRHNRDAVLIGSKIKGADSAVTTFRIQGWRFSESVDA